MTATHDSPSPSVDARAGASPEELRRAAAEADARAAEATAVADRAKAIAKKARKAASKAKVQAAALRASAHPPSEKSAPLTIAEAKAKLLGAAREIHPLRSAHETAAAHPFATVGIAAGVGAVLGATGGFLGNVVGGGAKLTASVLAFARPAVIALGKYAAAQVVMKQNAAKAEAERPAAGAPHSAYEAPVV